MYIYIEMLLFICNIIITIFFILSIGNYFHDTMMTTIPINIQEPNFDGLEGNYEWNDYSDFHTRNSSYEMSIHVHELSIKINIRNILINYHYDNDYKLDIKPDIYIYEKNYTNINLQKFVDYLQDNYFQTHPEMDTKITNIIFKIKYYIAKNKKNLSFYEIYNNIKQFILL